LATALRLYFASFKTRMAKAQALHDYLYQELSQMKDEVVITSPKVGGTPYILNFGLLHDKGSVVVEALSAKDIYVSTRSACSDRAKSGSHVLRAMGLADQIYDNSIRLSFEGGEDVSQGAEFISALKGILASLKKVN
jgi:cysteine desulfurase